MKKGLWIIGIVILFFGGIGVKHHIDQGKLLVLSLTVGIYTGQIFFIFPLTTYSTPLVAAIMFNSLSLRPTNKIVDREEIVVINIAATNPNGFRTG